RTSGVAADDVYRADEIERCVSLDRRLLRHPRLRQLEWRLIVVLRRVLISTSHRRRPWNLFSVLDKTLHCSDRQAQRERRVGIRLAAHRLESRIRDLGVDLRQWLVDAGLVLCSQLAGTWIDDSRDADHRIVGRIDDCLATFAEALALGDVLELRRANELRGH